MEEIYVGYDVARKEHAAKIVGMGNIPLGKEFTFQNTKEGFQKMYERIQRIAVPRNAHVVVGLESTGHYWYNLFSFIREKGWEIRVVNPLITKGYSKSDLRCTKTDYISAQLIAEMVCFGKIRRPYYFDKQDAELKELERIRHRLVEKMTLVKVQVQRIIDIMFPEYIGVWDDPCCLTSIRLLEKYPTPTSMLEAGREKIDKVIRKYNKTVYNPNMADQILAKAANTVGTTLFKEPNVTELRFLIAQYDVLKNQIREIEQKIQAHMDKRESLLFTIPGIDEVVASIIHGEAGDISRFESKEKFAAYCGLYPRKTQSGKFDSKTGPIAKRGNPRLRHGLYLAANNARTHNPVCKEQFDRLIAKGKPFKKANCAVARKLAHIVYSVLTNRKPFYVPAYIKNRTAC